MLQTTDLLLIFEIGQRHGVRAAAQALGMHQSTAFRRLDALERDLGVRLFERQRSGYIVTAAGARLCALAERLQDDLGGLERELRGRDMRPYGKVSVTATDTLVMTWLTPILARFRHRYPEIELEVIVSSQLLALSKREADVAIRPTMEPPEPLIGKAVVPVAVTIYAAKEYLRGAAANLSLQQQRWIGPDESLAHSSIAKWVRANVPEERIAYRINTVLGMLAAAKAGLGVAALPCYLADTQSDLVRLRAPVPELAAKLWLLTHRDLRRVARIRAFLSFVAAELASVRSVFEGRLPRVS